MPNALSYPWGYEPLSNLDPHDIALTFHCFLDFLEDGFDQTAVTKALLIASYMLACMENTGFPFRFVV